MSPKYTSRAEVSQEYMDHEKEILLAAAKKENPEKPENIIEKMIIGRLNKELKEICLLQVKESKRNRKTLQQKLQLRWETNLIFANL